MLELTESLFIARSIERSCYSHPNDFSKVIKIVGINENHRNQNELDYEYFQYLQNKQVPFTHITKCYGYIDTSLGQGLIFDKVYDYNNNISMSLKDFLIKKIYTLKQEDELLKQLEIYLKENNILFVDVHLSNILCCEYEKNKYKLMIIDGLGARRKGIKFYFYLKSNFFTRYKIIKQWKKFISNVYIVRNNR